MKLLSSLVLISLVLTTFPANGPKRVPFAMTGLLQKTPQWLTPPTVAILSWRPSGRSREDGSQVLEVELRAAGCPRMRSIPANDANSQKAQNIEWRRCVGHGCAPARQIHLSAPENTGMGFVARRFHEDKLLAITLRARSHSNADPGHESGQTPLCGSLL